MSERAKITPSPARIWKFGDGINTDDILPGKYAPLMVGEENYHKYAFAHLRPEFAAEVLPGDVLAGGWNWGLGSSREYAPSALKKLGVSAVIAKSFARIHFRNLINLGIPAIAAPRLIDLFEDADPVDLDPVHGWIRVANVLHEMPPLGDFAAEILAAGSLMAHFKLHKRFPGE
jgi:methanogen homoaconitase small subunit